jgi:hypothetical protein
MVEVWAFRSSRSQGSTFIAAVDQNRRGLGGHVLTLTASMPTFWWPFRP